MRIQRIAVLKTPGKGVFTGLAIYQSAVAGLFILSSVLSGEFPVGHELLLASTAIMLWCLSALHPHFAADDERWRKIRERGMFYNYFILLVFLAILLTVFALTPLEMSGYQTVSVIASFLISSAFITFVALSRKM
ncbi:hypothetical protein C772_02715 [Bhargavaea cecembensis DSE10]|uniref:Uncharacterized protein n=1 Tax=Bhargavaea cecembensis DSE10 TaxID=1235279 RepID=M7P4B2_9BACL|nr:hypothetical protein [Bhargavaea cecembensis]EMR05364.1 hypothetical protein C772_02715 [Bhargavaea cecembensis DSE10]